MYYKCQIAIKPQEQFGHRRQRPCLEEAGTVRYDQTGSCRFQAGAIDLKRYTIAWLEYNRINGRFSSP